jgi:hypothetical protein
MRVTWDKRYITLGPVCTLLGLAFRLQDPDHLLGKVNDLGITCALVPTESSRREHRPPPFPAQCRVPERPEFGQGRLHAAGLDHRRSGDGRPGLAHADGVPGGGALDFAAVLVATPAVAEGAWRA